MASLPQKQIMRPTLSQTLMQKCLPCVEWNDAQLRILVTRLHHSSLFDVVNCFSVDHESATAPGYTLGLTQKHEAEESKELPGMDKPARNPPLEFDYSVDGVDNPPPKEDMSLTTKVTPDGMYDYRNAVWTAASPRWAGGDGSLASLIWKLCDSPNERDPIATRNPNMISARIREQKLK